MGGNTKQSLGKDVVGREAGFLAGLKRSGCGTAELVQGDVASFCRDMPGAVELFGPSASSSSCTHSTLVGRVLPFGPFYAAFVKTFPEKLSLATTDDMDGAKQGSIPGYSCQRNFKQGNEDGKHFSSHLSTIPPT